MGSHCLSSIRRIAPGSRRLTHRGPGVAPNSTRAGFSLDPARPGLGLRALRGWLERGYIATTAGAEHAVLVLTPPLTIAEAQLDAAAAALGEVLHGLGGA